CGQLGFSIARQGIRLSATIWQRDTHGIHHDGTKTTAVRVAELETCAAASYPGRTADNHRQADVKNQSAYKRPSKPVRLVKDVDVRHPRFPLGVSSMGCVTMLTWSWAAPSSPVTCAIGFQTVSLSART